MSKFCLKTVSGRYINPCDVQIENISEDDILHSLSYQNRFNGHTRVPFSVAQHTLAMVFAAMEMEESMGVIKTILLHDMHEYIVGDIISPIKALFRKEFENIESDIDMAIYGYYGFLPTPAEITRMKDYDNVVWRVEAHVLMGADAPTITDDVWKLLEANVRRVHGWSPALTQEVFRTTLARCMVQCETAQ